MTTYRVQSFERLLFGANIDLETSGVANVEWFASELRKLYPEDVTVRASGPASIEIERTGGAVRVLKVAEDKRSWELADSRGPSGPAPIAAILAAL